MVTIAGPRQQASPESPSRAATRRRRLRQRRTSTAAVAIAGIVPAVLLLPLWTNLVEPFWFNEQWRAYFIANNGDWWNALRIDGAPFPAGWFFLERFVSELFGSTELTLRLATAAFLPATSVLLTLWARRWMPVWGAAVIALVASLTGTLLVYAVQLSEYQVDACATVAVLLLHEIAWQPSASRRSTLLAYGGIALACIFATPALFIAAPILLLDMWRSRSDLRTVHVAAAVGAGSVILLHLGLFVVRQNALTKSSYWDAQFLPHHGLGKQFSFVVDGLRGFVSNAFASSYSDFPGTMHSVKPVTILTVCFSILLVLGLGELLRSERGRTVVAALAGSVVLTLVASYLRYWPFGFVRTNIYVVPVLVFVAGLGAARAVGRLRSGTDGARKSRRGLLHAAVLLVAICGLLLALSSESGSYRQLIDPQPNSAYGDQIGQAVAFVRSRSSESTVLIVEGAMAVDGWGYYEFEYSGRTVATGPQPRPSDVVITSTAGDPQITAAVAQQKPSQVYLYVPWGTEQDDIHSDLDAIAKGWPCILEKQYGYSVSGLLLSLKCQPTP